MTTQVTIPAVMPEAWRDAVKVELRRAVEGSEALATGEEALIRRKLRAAYRHAEEYLRRSLLIQTRTVIYDASEIWGGTVVLPYGPARSIVHVKEWDDDDNATTVATANYRLEGASGGVDYVWPSRLVAQGGGWQVTRSYNALEVRYVAGYAAAFTVTTADTFTSRGHPFSDGDSFYIYSYGGDLPGGLSEDTLYYVRDAAAHTFKVETSVGGGAVDITDPGSGLLTCGQLPEDVHEAIVRLTVSLMTSREDQMSGVNLAPASLTSLGLLSAHRPLVA